MKKILLSCLFAALTLVACQKQKVMEPAATAARAEASYCKCRRKKASVRERNKYGRKITK